MGKRVNPRFLRPALILSSFCFVRLRSSKVVLPLAPAYLCTSHSIDTDEPELESCGARRESEVDDKEAR